MMPEWQEPRLRDAGAPDGWASRLLQVSSGTEGRETSNTLKVVFTLKETHLNILEMESSVFLNGFNLVERQSYVE